MPVRSSVKRLALALALASTSASAQELSRHEFESPQMGTRFKIILYAADAVSARTAADSAFALAEELNASFSDYDAQSELRLLIARGKGTASPRLFDILTIAKSISRETGGAFDITAGAHTRNWRRARITGELPTPQQLRSAVAASGWKKLKLAKDGHQITLPRGMQLDLGGIAKGYAADEMLSLLKKAGFPIASVAAGGDIAVGDPPPGQSAWKIAISPDGTSKTRTLRLANRAVSTSGNAEQQITIEGTTYSHIVDPRTGLGLTASIPVSVIARRATQSDAYATALSVLGKEKSKAIVTKLEFEAIWGESSKER